MSGDDTKDLIDYILSNTALNQTEIAKKLKVSRAQVSKWKAGDYVSSERTSQLLELAGLFDTVSIGWAVFAKTEENAKSWYEYMHDILDGVYFGSSLQDYFQDMPDIYSWHVIDGLRQLGANIEPQAPNVKSQSESGEEEDLEEASDQLYSTLFSVLEAWGQLMDWIDCTIDLDDVTDDAQYELFDASCDLEWLAFDLALDHVDEEELIAIGVQREKLQATIKESRDRIESHLHHICTTRIRHGLPITDDYFQLLYLPAVELGEQSWFRPTAVEVGPNTIKKYLPYGERLILMHLQNGAIMMNELHDKLEKLISKSNKKRPPQR